MTNQWLAKPWPLLLLLLLLMITVKLLATKVKPCQTADILLFESFQQSHTISSGSIVVYVLNRRL